MQYLALIMKAIIHVKLYGTKREKIDRFPWMS